MQIVAGTYNHLIFGYELQNSNELYRLKMTFSNESHGGSVKSLAVSNDGQLATGGNDELIRLFSLQPKKKEIGSICEHNGSIVKLAYFKNSHLFSGSEDCTINVWSTVGYDCIKRLKHKESIIDFAIHPTGKLLLSTCKDRTMQTWNLVNGKRAFIINLKQVGEIIHFKPNGTSFLIVNGSLIDFYSTETGCVIHQIQSSFRICTTIFLNENILLVGGDGGLVDIFELKTFSKIHQINTETIRVKNMAISKSEKLVIASSDGYLKVYSIQIDENKSNIVMSKLLAQTLTSYRWLCVTVFEPNNDNEKNIDNQLTVEDSDIELKVDSNNEENSEESFNRDFKNVNNKKNKDKLNKIETKEKIITNRKKVFTNDQNKIKGLNKKKINESTKKEILKGNSQNDYKNNLNKNILKSSNLDKNDLNKKRKDVYKKDKNLEEEIQDIPLKKRKILHSETSPEVNIKNIEFHKTKEFKVNDNVSTKFENTLDIDTDEEINKSYIINKGFLKVIKKHKKDTNFKKSSTFLNSKNNKKYENTVEFNDDVESTSNQSKKKSNWKKKKVDYNTMGNINSYEKNFSQNQKRRFQKKQLKSNFSKDKNFKNKDFNNQKEDYKENSFTKDETNFNKFGKKNSHTKNKNFEKKQNQFKKKEFNKNSTHKKKKINKVNKHRK